MTHCTEPSSTRRARGHGAKRPRAGFTLIELVVATAVLMALLAMVGQSLVFLGRTHQSSRNRLLAAETAANVLEAVLTYPARQVTAELLATPPVARLARSTDSTGPTSNWKVELEVQNDVDVGAKRVTVTVRKQAAPEELLASLSGWLFHDQP